MNASGDWWSSASRPNAQDTGSVTYHAKLYDLLFNDYALDIPMYLRELPQNLPVLECGIGTGRVAIPLARSGRSVVGLDNSSTMLHELKSKLKNDTPERAMITIVEADLRSFALGTGFSSIICPFMTFNYLLTLQDRVGFLRSAGEHMADNGVLWLELMTMNTLPEMTTNQGIPRKVVTRGDMKLSYTIYRTVSFDSASQIVEQERHYVAYDSEGQCQGTTLVTWRNRYVSFGELEATLMLCGLEIEAVYGNHDMGPFLSSSQFLIVKARRSQHSESALDSHFFR
jgi:SAM-dependent methyltransferase